MHYNFVMSSLLPVTFRRHVGVFLRGACMGVADLIPGVSGGTIAFISGIYARLLTAVGAFSTPTLWREVFRFQIVAVWRRADGEFLAVLMFGILSAIILFGGVLRYLLSEHAHLLLAFFCGLVMASVVLVFAQLEVKRPPLKMMFHRLLLFIFGAAAALLVVSLPTTTIMPSLPTLFFGGAIAISAMLLPGISGSYILLIVGLYAHILEALHARDFVSLLVFAAGCGGGLLAFARVLSYLMNRFHDGMLFLLAGIMLGALPKLWPWKSEGEGVKIILQPNVMPSDFVGDAQPFLAVVLCIFGALVVTALHATAKRINT